MLRLSSLRRTAWAAILAVLLHAFAPLAHAMPRVAGLPMGLANFCGTVTPQLLAEGIATSEQPDSASLARYCPQCLAGAHIALEPAPAACAALDTTLRHVRVVQPATGKARVAPRPPFSSRAPPRA